MRDLYLFCAVRFRTVAHAEHTVIVDRPISEVFAFFADGTNVRFWRPEVTNIEHVSGSGLDAQYAQTMKAPAGGPSRVTSG